MSLNWGETSAQSKHSLGWYILRLMQLRLRILWSTFRHGKLRQKIGTIVFYGLMLVLMGFIIYISWQILELLQSPDLLGIVADVRPLMDSVPVLILSGAFLGVLLTSFGVLLQALYLAGDMDFLLSIPLPIRAVFLTKLIQAILPNFSLAVAFGLPVLFGLGIGIGYHWVYYPLVVIVMACLALAAAGLSSLLVMGVVRIFPARRVAEVLGFLGFTLTLICSQSGNLMSGVDFEDINAGNFPLPLDQLARFNHPLSPLAWAGRGLTYLGQGNWLPGFFFVSLTLGLTLLIFLVSLNAAEKLYYSGWANVQVGGLKRRVVRKAAPEMASPRWGGLRLFSQWIVSSIPQPVRGIIHKDSLVLRRDLRNLSQVVSPMIFGLIYAVMLLRGSGEAPAEMGDAPDWLMQSLNNLMVYASIGISLFVAWGLASRLAGIGFSQEGQNYWLLKTAPLKPEELLTAKFIVAYLPALVLGWFYLILISLLQRAGFGVFLYGLAVVALCVSGIVGIDLSFGVRGVNLTWIDSRHMRSSASGCISLVVGWGYLMIALTLYFMAPTGLALLGLPDWVGWLAGLALGGGFSLFCAFVPPILVRRHLVTLGEDGL